LFVTTKLRNSEQVNGRWTRNYVERIERAHADCLVRHDVRGEQMKHLTDETLRAA